jgi:hypothetical protein
MVVKRRDESMLNKIQLVGVLLNSSELNSSDIKAHTCAMDAELLILAVEETLLLQPVGH